MTKPGGYIRKKRQIRLGSRRLGGAEKKKLCEVFGLYLARSSIEKNKLFSGWVKNRKKICNYCLLFFCKTYLYSLTKNVIFITVTVLAKTKSQFTVFLQ